MSVFLQEVPSESLGAAIDLTLVACRSLLRVCRKMECVTPRMFVGRGLCRKWNLFVESGICLSKVESICRKWSLFVESGMYLSKVEGIVESGMYCRIRNTF